MPMKVSSAPAVSRWLQLAAGLVLVVPFALQAQTGTIVGRVTDAATQGPVAEARVTVVGTALVTSTNASGDYRLVNVRPGRVTITVFRLGYKAAGDTVRVQSGETVTLNVAMTASLAKLSEVVVTGTAGNQERRAQSAQVASLTVAEIVKEAPIRNVGEVLQSRIPGVAVSSNSGVLGTAKTIRIRGASSVNLSNQPLLFIDGVRINEGPINGNVSGQSYDRMNDLNPDEIESIEVVKGPAAATLYGADASAGVIQIITKKGRPGGNRFVQSLRLESGTTDQNYMPPDSYGNCTAALVAANSTNPLCRGQPVGTLVHDNVWKRYNVLRTGKDLSVGWGGRGGGQNYGYNLSFGADNATGTLANSGLTRYNVRSNFNYVPDSRLTIDFGLGLGQNRTQLPNLDNSLYGWIAGALLGSPLTRSDNPANSADGWFGYNRHYNAIAAITNRMLTHRTMSNLTASYLPVSWFTNRITLGVDYASDEQFEFNPRNDSTWYGGQLDAGRMNRQARGAERYTVDYLGNMRRTFGANKQWEGNLSVGLQVVSTRNTLTSATGIGFVTNENNAVTSAATTTGGSSYTAQKQYGYLSQLQLGYQNRLFLQMAVRVDKNSAFGSAAPAFVLPKVGATWTISEEPFFEGFTKVINSLRLRAAWGTTGRSPAPGAALTTLVSAPYNIFGTTSNGANPGNPGNADLKPERGTEFEAGFDASFWRDRISAELTYFHKVTDDLIIAKPIAPSLGFNSNPLQNIGSVLNSGLELAVNASAISATNFLWDVRLGANTLHNEVTDLGGVAAFAPGGSFSHTRAMLGQQLGVYVAKRIKSIDEATGVVVVSDTVSPVGNLYPTLEWNLTNTFTVMKQFRISALLDAKRDFITDNFTDFYRETQLVRGQNRLDPNKLSRRERLRRYGNDTPGKPAFVTESGVVATQNDVYEAWEQPGDFLRFRELSVTYLVPKRLSDALGNRIQNASLQFAMQNLKLWTDYEGPDPEVVTDSGNFSRADFFTLPNPRRALFRVNFTF
ncbi:MAG: SusC/RagA family TonB-linked outer membrane protein [Gemmatimonadaceae bacterium]|nr:SusC/RagA family TonB-linked outer membrane protein [Gemmatimonadaceae bacterium]